MFTTSAPLPFQLHSMARLLLSPSQLTLRPTAPHFQSTSEVCLDQTHQSHLPTQLFLFTSLLLELQTGFRRPKPPRTSLTTIRASLSLLGITRKLSHYIIKVLIHLPKDPTPGYQVLDYLRDIPGFSVPSLALVLL